MITQTIEVGEYSATIQGRRRGASILAARYEGWLLEQYPNARQARIAVMSLPRPTEDNLAEQSLYQKHLTGIQVNLAEGYEQAAWIAEFASLATRLQEAQSPQFAMRDSFDREGLHAAYLDYLSEEGIGGFWAAVEKAIRAADKPLSPAAESGADPKHMPTGLETSNET